MAVYDVTLPAYYLRQIAEQVGEAGVPADGWLARRGLGPQRLAEPLVTLAFAEFRLLILDALAMSREPALGLLVGSRLLVNTHGILGYAAMSGGSIRQVLAMAEKYISLRENLVAIAHEERDDELIVRFTPCLPLGDIERPVLEAVVLAIKNIVDFITLGSCRIRRVAFPFAADRSAALARELFGCPVSYGSPWAGFTLPLAVIDQPLRMADPAAFQDATRICQQELDRRHDQETLAARVRRLLLQTQSDFPSLQLTARYFHLTPRTLHRRLEDEGTSFRQIQEEVRHALALEYLKAGKLSIQEIAYTLGYTQIANFRRAFKRWEQVPPSQYGK